MKTRVVSGRHFNDEKQRDLMHVYVYISIGYFLFYDDKRGHTHYDDDGDHVEHDTQESTDLRTSLRIASSMMMGLEGAKYLRIHTHTYGSCVRKYYVSMLVWTGGHP